MYSRSHIESVCKCLCVFKGKNHRISACYKNKFKRYLNKILKRNILSYDCGKDWKVIDEQGTIFVGSLDECIDYFLKYE